MAVRTAALVAAGACLASDALRKQRATSTSEPLAAASLGGIFGKHEACDQFLGIPYAKAPVGDLRFADPVPWTQAYPSQGLNATKAGAQCVSTDGDGSEDCLFLNVFRPQGVQAGANLPVMVWLHGGAFVTGHGAEPMWIGCNLANAQNVIVVSMNYRLSIFGFGTFENEDGSISSNWAMEDQRTAFRWVQKEINAFGGDATRVTAFGESAGGISIWHHLITEKSRGLFHRAIIQSGFPSGKELPAALGVTEDMGRRMQCQGSNASGPALRACLRSRSALAIQNADDSHNIFSPDLRLFQRWEPVQDGVELAAHPYKVLQDGGSFSNIPLIIGSNTDEGNFFAYLLWLLPMWETQYRNDMKSVWQNNPGTPSKNLNESEVNQVLVEYPPRGWFADNRGSVSNQISDSMFHCSTRLGGRHHSARSPVWSYLYNYTSSNCQWVSPLNNIPGVFHTYEISFVFGNIKEAFGLVGCDNLEPDGWNVVHRMQQYWGNFARTGNPNNGSSWMELKDWPKYDGAAKKELTIQGRDSITSDFRGTYCNFWERLLYTKVMS